MMSDSRRKDSMQRIQIGLAGLAGVVLLVGLANIVIKKAGVDDDVAASAVDGAPLQLVPGDNAIEAVPVPVLLPEPLAELGVTPPPPEEPAVSAKGKNISGQVVPDLEPNPALRKPMDREP
ncbi:MAG: hypothetical protein JJE34_02105 [Alphaproteobacteria bacterium]|nr:hypothetical protein [Alphaproteobacteria bacterium]